MARRDFKYKHGSARLGGATSAYIPVTMAANEEEALYALRRIKWRAEREREALRKASVKISLSRFSWDKK
jgi:hypothetical protein